MSSVFEKELEAVALKALEAIAAEDTGNSSITSEPSQSDLHQTTKHKKHKKHEKRDKRDKRRKISRLPLLHSLHYIALLRPDELEAVNSSVDGLVAITPVATVPEFISMTTTSRDSGILIDLSLLSASDIAAIKADMWEHPRSIVAYTSRAGETGEMALGLARETAAQFVFAQNQFAGAKLQRALLLAPNAEVSESLCSALANQLALLGGPLCATITRMIRCGDGPPTPDAIVAHCKLNRRTVERRFVAAGLAPSRLFVAAARIVRAYSAITRSSVPLRSIANLLGYTTQRAMDSHLQTLLARTSSELRAMPLPREAAAEVMARKLTSSHRHERNGFLARQAPPSLTLLTAS